MYLLLILLSIIVLSAADQGRQMAMQMSMQQSPMAGKQQPSKMFEVCVS